MSRPAPASPRRDAKALVERLGAQERAVLAVLASQPGRVVSRTELAHRAGLAELSARRCDSLLVGIRRAIGADAIITVRRRGWMLVPGVVDSADLGTT